MLFPNYMHFRNIFEQLCTVSNYGRVKGKGGTVDKKTKAMREF